MGDYGGWGWSYGWDGVQERMNSKCQDAYKLNEVMIKMAEVFCESYKEKDYDIYYPLIDA